MVASLPLPVLIMLFAIAAGAVWLAGSRLSDTTDLLASRLGLGEALGGLILLAIATNLPEIAITASAALHHDLELAIGNILGGIAIQTVVLVLLDAVGIRGDEPLTYRAASLELVLEGVLVIAVLVVAIMAAQLPASLSVARLAPGSLSIALFWAAGVWLLGKARSSIPWQARGDAPGGQEARGVARAAKAQRARAQSVSTGRAATIFGVAALITLVSGIVLELSGDAIARRAGVSGVLFGATALAAATALPEVSSGLASVKLGDYELAISDIFGGNAFLPVLFLLATALSGRAALPQAQSTDIYLAGLGILLTTLYITGLILRPTRRVARMGVDSLGVLALYLVGLAGLAAVVRG